MKARIPVVPFTEENCCQAGTRIVLVPFDGLSHDPETRGETLLPTNQGSSPFLEKMKFLRLLHT